MPDAVDLIRPMGLYPRQNGIDLLSRKLVGKTRHASSQWHATEPDGTAQNGQGVMPGVSRAIEWWRGQLSIGVQGAPLGRT